MAKLWTEHRIRVEFRRLDGITGLSGAELPIEFDRKGRTVGCFHRFGDVMYFSFSRRYLDDPDIAEIRILDVIRHEYAHYMNAVRSGEAIDDGHGPHWQACCAEVDALPLPEMPDSLEKFLRLKHPDAPVPPVDDRWRVGDTLTHPSFGAGEITAVTGFGDACTVEVSYDPNIKRKFSGAWLRTHLPPQQN